MTLIHNFAYSSINAWMKDNAMQVIVERQQGVVRSQKEKKYESYFADRITVRFTVDEMVMVMLQLKP